MDELGRVLVSICSMVPDGIVVFFCSYDHLQKTYAYFEKTSVLNQITQKKKVRNLLSIVFDICICYCLDFYGAKTDK